MLPLAGSIPREAISVVSLISCCCMLSRSAGSMCTHCSSLLSSAKSISMVRVVFGGAGLFSELVSGALLLPSLVGDLTV